MQWPTHVQDEDSQNSIKLHVAPCGAGAIRIEYRTGPFGGLPQIKYLKKRRIAHSRLLCELVDVSRGGGEMVTLPFEYSKFAAWESWTSSGARSLGQHLDAIQVAMFLQDEQTTKSAQSSLHRLLHTALVNHTTSPLFQPDHHLTTLQDAVLSLNDTAQEAIMHGISLQHAIYTPSALRHAWLRSHSSTLILPPSCSLSPLHPTPIASTKRQREPESPSSHLIAHLMRDLPPAACTALELQDDSDFWTQDFCSAILSHLPALREVDLTNSTLNVSVSARCSSSRQEDPRRGVPGMASALARLPCLQALSLQKCSVDNSCMEVLAPYLKRMTGLTALDLTHNMLSKSATEALGKALPALTRLAELHLGEIIHTTNGRAALISIGLHKLNSPALLQLHLGGNALPSSAGWLAQHLPLMSNLESLDLSGTLKQIGGGDAEGLAAAIGQLRALKRLDLSDNYLDSSVLCRNIYSLPCLQHMELSLENVNLESLQALAACVLSMAALTSLEVRDLSCGNQEGDLMLCSLAGHLSSLHMLQLVAHCVSGSQMEPFGVFLGELPCLYELKFDSCEFRSDKTTECVLETVRNLNGLRSVVLDTRIRRFSHDVTEMVFSAMCSLSSSIVRCDLSLPEADQVLLVAPYLSQMTALRDLRCSSGLEEPKAVKSVAAKALYGSACKLPHLEHLACFNIGTCEPLLLEPYLTQMSSLKRLWLPLGKPSHSILELKDALGVMKSNGALQCVTLYGVTEVSDAVKDSITELLPVTCSFELGTPDVP